jgi:hypothetical protein
MHLLSLAQVAFSLLAVSSPALASITRRATVCNGHAEVGDPSVVPFGVVVDSNSSCVTSSIAMSPMLVLTTRTL